MRCIERSGRKVFTRRIVEIAGRPPPAKKLEPADDDDDEIEPIPSRPEIGFLCDVFIAAHGQQLDEHLHREDEQEDEVGDLGDAAGDFTVEGA